MNALSLNFKKTLIYFSVAVFISWTLFVLFWDSSGKPTEISTWSCTGTGRNQICEINNFCVDSSHGPFIYSEHKDPPPINIINTGETDDIWFQPKRVTQSLQAEHLNETVFVYGLYSPYHFSHSLYNGLMPLYSVMQEKGFKSTSWTMRVGTYDNKHAPVDLLLPNRGKDIVLERQDVHTPKQILPRRKPMCFSKAIIGTGNRCSLWYCDNQIPSEHYASFKSFALEQPEIPNNPCASSIVNYKPQGQFKIGILNRKNSRHITNIPDLIDRLTSMNRAKDGIDFAVSTIDFENGCDIVNTAHVVKNLDILIAPFGNGLGAGLFMKDDSVVISIAARYWNEQWFKYPMTAIGRRIFNFECNSEVCKEYDQKLAEKILSGYNVKLNKTEMQTFLTTSNPENVLGPYIQDRAWDPFLQYYKDVARRVEVDRFIPFLKNIIANTPPKNVTYAESCKKPNVCCDLDCSGPLDRNVFGEKSVWN